MAPENSEILSDEAQLALVHTPPIMRGPLRIFFELDQRLGRIVAATSEPMLGQMRLAWWRDTLGKPVEDRPRGDVVLDGIADHLAGREGDLVELVDGWEHLIGSEELVADDARAFMEKRSAALVALFGGDEISDDQTNAIASAAWHWACADFAANVSSQEERDLIVKLGLSRPRSKRALHRTARGVAVLGALGWRSLAHGGRPLLEGRTASLVAARAAIFGR